MSNDHTPHAALRSASAADGRRLIDLDRAACLALLATKSVGRLVFTHRALPDVLPVNFWLAGENVLIRLASGSTAAVATRDAVVAFQVDDIDDLSGTGWSVTAVGRALEITDADERLQAAARGLDSWVLDGRDHLLSIAAEKLTGRRLVGSEPDQPRTPRLQ
jgi:nitroimidazol reductase NimA-like FMN-containing flavoprotein (pyridoxamine 5'-phosphate oxidase superfamily)